MKKTSLNCCLPHPLYSIYLKFLIFLILFASYSKVGLVISECPSLKLTHSNSKGVNQLRPPTWHLKNSFEMLKMKLVVLTLIGFYFLALWYAWILPSNSWMLDINSSSGSFVHMSTIYWYLLMFIGLNPPKVWKNFYFIILG